MNTLVPIKVLSNDRFVPNGISTDEIRQNSASPAPNLIDLMWNFGKIVNPANNTDDEIGLLISAGVVANALNLLPVQFTLLAILDNTSTIPAVFDYAISDPLLNIRETVQVR